MSQFAIYLTGYIIFIIGLAIAAHLLGVPSIWIGAGVVILLGLGLIGAASSNRHTVVRRDYDRDIL
jgi:hypothetical protein